MAELCENFVDGLLRLSHFFSPHRRFQGWLEEAGQRGSVRYLLTNSTFRPLGEGRGEAVPNSDTSALGGCIVLLDSQTTLRSAYATLSNQQRKPSFKFGTSDEFGSVILLLSNKGVQPVGSQCLTQG
jgi:hypothetical protein